MKKVLNQTVRDLKREVNKMVLKVPSIEQKTLDATSNEPWAPRGSLMAEIAQASCNHNDYQLVMAVLWKRIQDTGKNWRHVYKALSVLEYLAIYGSERVIDDIREHAYQISTLSDFLYTDSNGRDQGSNVRRKSQSLVALVNNKKRLQEVRDKALANKVSWSPLSSSARYNGDHFEGGNRGFGLVQRDLVLKDKDRYRDGGDKYSQDRPRSPGVDVCSNNSFDDYDRHSTSFLRAAVSPLQISHGRLFGLSPFLLPRHYCVRATGTPHPRSREAVFMRPGGDREALQTDP